LAKHVINCGEIISDDVMEWCQDNDKFLNHDQFQCGYEWLLDLPDCWTNNDHFFNGVRVAVMDGKLDPADVEIIYRKWNPKKENHDVTSIILDRNGRCDSWPDGFFDEIDKALERLTQWNLE
jgi:hypothetical protein